MPTYDLLFSLRSLQGQALSKQQASKNIIFLHNYSVNTNCKDRPIAQYISDDNGLVPTLIKIKVLSETSGLDAEISRPDQYLFPETKTIDLDKATHNYQQISIIAKSGLACFYTAAELELIYQFILAHQSTKTYVFVESDFSEISELLPTTIFLLYYYCRVNQIDEVLSTQERDAIINLKNLVKISALKDTEFLQILKNVIVQIDEIKHMPPFDRLCITDLAHGRYNNSPDRLKQVLLKAMRYNDCCPFPSLRLPAPTQHVKRPVVRTTHTDTPSKSLDTLTTNSVAKLSSFVPSAKRI